MLLLDTCAILWLAQGGGALSGPARQRINAASVVYVSAISGFEIGIKQRKGKLILPARPGEWLNTVVSHHGLNILPLSLEMCVRATELPEIHRDPCDRLIIASAEIMNLPVVTADVVFQQYGIETMC